MNIDELLLWKYIDGKCSPSEILEVELYLKAHPEKQLELDSRKAFDALMTEQPLEVPSLRFVQNVMEKSGALARTTIEPLMSARARWAFGTLAILFAVLYLLTAYLLGSSMLGNTAVLNLVSSLQQFTSVMNSQIVVIVATTSLAGCLFFGLDFYLNRKNKFHTN